VIGFRIGKAVAGSAHVTARAGLFAAALALVSGEAIAIECPRGWVKEWIGPGGNQHEACRYCYECNIGTTPQTSQPRAPAKAVPAPCSADLVARYLAEVARQPLSRRPAPGSVVALTENRKPCVLQMPAAAAAPPPQQRVIVGTQTVDGQTYVIINIEPLKPLPPSGNYNQFVPAFGPWAAQVGRNVEDHLFVHTNYIGPNGEPVMVASPYITDGVINAAETSARLSHAGIEAGANWVKNNPQGIAAMAVAMMVCAAVPAAPIAAWALGGEAAGVIGTAAEAVVGGMIYSGTQGAVKSMITDFGSDKSAGQQLINMLGSGAAGAITSIPGSLLGHSVSSMLSPYVATRTAKASGWLAGKGADKALAASGFTNAAQMTLTGQLPGPEPKQGGIVITTTTYPSLSPQPGAR
jgi:hypothetical protein